MAVEAMGRGKGGMWLIIILFLIFIVGMIGFTMKLVVEHDRDESVAREAKRLEDSIRVVTAREDMILQQKRDSIRLVEEEAERRRRVEEDTVADFGRYIVVDEGAEYWDWGESAIETAIGGDWKVHNETEDDFWKKLFDI